jgi:hypothetical protein
MGVKCDLSFRMSENRLWRRMFGSKSDEVRGGWRKICNAEQNDQSDNETDRAYSIPYSSYFSLEISGSSVLDCSGRLNKFCLIVNSTDTCISQCLNYLLLIYARSLGDHSLVLMLWTTL